ncbi:MAG: hypothetical protein JXQ30_13485 [Spirochaetes bacterium]|nr:hypothetical protein [Spirochaetota bacterium]
MSVDKRVFQIDNECYIVYLGADREDYKPFLRIGNSKRLTEKIISHVYNIVITDSYTGNPALEPGNINRRIPKENRYVGTKQTVERFLEFLKNCAPETDKITRYQNGAVSEGGALVSFFDDGNMRLSLKKKLVFDLKSSEKRDRHFVERTRMLSDQHSKDGLRYRNAEFKQPGFCIVEGNTLVFNREKIIAVGLPDDYFATLIRYGIDPDLVSGLVTEDASPAVIELFKRKQYRKQEVSILTNNPGLLQSALDLFGTQLFSRLTDLRKKTKQSLYEFSIGTADGTLMLACKALGFTLAISAADRKTEEGVFLIDPSRNIFTYSACCKKIADGVPYVFERAAPFKSGITESYFSSLFDFFSNLLSQSELIAVKQLEKFFTDIEHDTRFAASLSHAKKGLKQIGRNPSPGVFFILSNACEICGMLKDKKANNPDVCGALDSLKARIIKRTGSFDRVAEPFPLVCRLFISDESVVPLYLLTKDTVTKDEYTLSADARRSMAEIGEKALEKYDEELALLSALMEELELPPPPPPPPEEKGEAAGDLEAAGGVPSGRMEIKAQTGARPSGGKKDGKRKGIIIAAAVVLAAILIVVFLVIPKRTGDETQTTVETAVSTAGGEEAEGTEAFVLTEPTPPNLIRITILDIYLLTNRIARENGFRELDTLPELGKDPDWIYPGNTFTLPDGTVYEVVDGDTVWYIAERYIRKTLEADWVEYNKILKAIEKSGGVADDKEKLRVRLENLKSGSFSENFRREVDRTILEMGA